ncbi:dTDP-4-amino-4,6-dideoxygalactose transaminase [Desulfopila sp. IMCC35006]|uniref:dTDP-4-amino-4,6-dideoxygalactose transaminase n=1 Tax=Desulfopila sp. IMCC35006 TaxID=2569542 RepID=UPI0010ACB07A|nr:dTDP-4-amino-4,6-dideoxygalactose transaminase [Desulfopila sp. IMCC35006]TKB26123.1 dTDP-4-amino-4,6-dideoxygalactose transaminase [Desulfopila sp. IMCC35006]
MTIRFNFPYLVGTELEYIQDAVKYGRLAGDGLYTRKCSELLEAYLGHGKVLLTHSCTAALEIAAILADIQPGDEVIMPSYTFVSTANAFVLRGGVPVFIDIRPDTLNIDERLIEAAITPRTKAIVPVHYAGVACEMDFIMEIARHHGLLVIEDAAQALGSSYKGRKLGTLGDFAAFSFHETKNIVSGEGGALVINTHHFVERAEVIREKGTNRSRFFRGEVDKYTWVDVGSSYLPSELVAAFLYAQLQHINEINQKRMLIWKKYESTLQGTAHQGHIRLPVIPEACVHNAHLFYLLTRTHAEQIELLAAMKAKGVNAVFHYIPLHATDAGQRFSKTGSSMAITEDLAWRLIRLPIYPGLGASDQHEIQRQVIDWVSDNVR